MRSFTTRPRKLSHVASSVSSFGSFSCGFLQENQPPFDKCRCCQPFDDILAAAWSGESLQEFLENQPSGDNRFGALFDLRPGSASLQPGLRYLAPSVLLRGLFE